MELASEFASRNAFVDNWDAQMQRIKCNQKLLFDDLGSFNVRIIRMAEGKEALLLAKTETELEEHLLKTSEDSFSILSFCQEFSLSPLMCSTHAMLNVIQKWQISGMFVDVLLKFGDQPRVFQESSGSRQLCQSKDGSFELSYQFMYVEHNGKKAPRDPWSYRQTGVYHKFYSSIITNRVVLLHPNNEAVAQLRLQGLVDSPGKAALAQHPLNIHLVIVSSYLIHWQEYIESLASQLEQIRRHLEVVDNSGSDGVPTINPDRLQTLRHLEDKIVCKASKCLRSTITLVKTLMEINTILAASSPSFVETSWTVQQELGLFEHRLQGHVDAVDILTQRVQATLGLLENLIDIGNQANSRQISTRILSLTKDSVEDNATVKVITVFTLIYLPASFMASFLGMNLFEFKVDDGSLQASPQFWIFIVTTVPLTMLTVGAWYLYKTRHDKVRRARHRHDEERV